MPSPILRYFEYEHLPPHLRDVSMPVCLLARDLDKELPDGPEKSAGLRKLLEAKDCFVRAALDLKKPAPHPMAGTELTSADLAKPKRCAHSLGGARCTLDAGHMTGHFYGP